MPDIKDRIREVLWSHLKPGESHGDWIVVETIYPKLLISDLAALVREEVNRKREE